MMKRRKTIALLTALTLLLVLAAGCGSRETEQDASGPIPAENQPSPAVEPEAGPPESETPEEEAPEEEAPAAVPADSQPEETDSESEPEPAPEPEPEPAGEPEPVPEPAPELQPEETLPEDGIYTANVTLEGGTGRASVESPAFLRCEDGKFWATIVWSSSNFDYMKVDGERYDLLNDGGNSTFEIPVAEFDRKLDVIADTVAMSEPHEVEYTLLFDSASLQKQ